jgi:type I restriction enzyme M protein
MALATVESETTRWGAGCTRTISFALLRLRNKSLEESDDLPEPDVLAQEIADDLQTALEQFQAIAETLKG